MEKGSSREKRNKQSTFLVKFIAEAFTGYRYRQIDSLSSKLPDSGSSPGPLSVKVDKGREGFGVEIWRDPSTIYGGCHTTVNVTRDELYGHIVGVNAAVTEFRDEEPYSTRSYKTFGEQPNSMSLGEVVGVLRLAVRELTADS